MLDAAPPPEPQPPSSVSGIFADVIVPRHLNRSFTYRVPQRFHHQVRVGSLVQIPFGSSTVRGIVVSLSNSLPGAAERAGYAQSGLREILSLPGASERSQLDPEALDLVRFVSDYYLTPLGQCARLVLPPEPPAGGSVSYAITDAGRQTLAQHKRLSKTARAVLTRLAESARGLSLSTIQRSVDGSVTRALHEMTQQQCVEKRTPVPAVVPHRSSRRASRRGIATQEDTFPQLDGLGLESTTLPAVLPAWEEKVHAALESNQHSTVLLEARAPQRWAALLTACDAAFRLGRKALVVTGEQSRAGLLAAQARTRWGDRVELWHGGLSDAARSQAWQRLSEGMVDLVIGTRSAVFLPLAQPGLVCVDAEEETSLKEEQAPRYHAREVAAERAKRSHALLILGSARPSVHARKLLEDGAEGFVVAAPPTSRPGIQAVDLRSEPYGTVLTEPMLRGVESALAANRGAILYHNRKGYAPFLLCRECGASPRCSRCSLPLTYYKQSGRLTCRCCGAASAPPETCHACRSTSVEPAGFGTEWLEAEIRKRFPRARVARLDRDLTAATAVARQIRRQAWAGELDVLVGTQMLLQGPPLPPAGFVGIPLADSGLHMPDFRAAERTYHALEKVVGLARSADTGGQVVVQTYLPTHHVVASVVSGDPEVFYRQELDFRRALGYPPYGTLISLRASGTKAPRVRGASLRWAELLSEAASRRVSPSVRGGQGRDGQPVTVLGPIPASVSQLRGRYRWQLLVTAKEGVAARHVVRESLDRMEREKGWHDVKLEVDVDPLDMS